MTYLRFDAVSLPSNVGKDGANGARLSDGRGGHISFGPYFEADAGAYVAGFYVRRIGRPAPSKIGLDILANGKHELARRTIRHAELFEDIPTFVFTTFAVTDRIASVEARLHVEADGDVEVQSLVVFSTPVRSWGGL
jgi:hypothetical protein